ncbi:MAG TPA: cytochrome c-type biogenesis protein CcmH [Acidobacteriota bacterium]|jgi:cytochrome c-type biogenesis protein CcmH|nr:cytochrome c-type biogenesis protein CcmH [Acidobacteriota bacterium]
MRQRRFFFLWLIAMAPLLGAQPVTLTPAQEQEAKAIENLLIAPCCWRQPVAVHYSAAADEVRMEIRTLLTQGRSRQEILDYFVAEYGAQILAKPPAEGFGAVAYYLPWLFLLAGAGLAVLLIRRLRPAPAAVTEGVTDLSADKEKDPYAERLKQELWG